MVDQPASVLDDPNLDVIDAASHTVIPKAVSFTEIPLEGQPATDKAYQTETGTMFRARVVRIDEQITRAPTNGSPLVAPSGITLSLTLALLDANMDVAKDESGALLIMDRHEIVFSDEAMKNPAFDPKAAVETALGQQAHLLEVRIDRRNAAQTYLAEWGGAVGAADASAALDTLAPASVSITVADMIAQQANDKASGIVEDATAEAVKVALQGAADQKTEQIAEAVAQAEERGRLAGIAEEAEKRAATAADPIPS